MAAQRLFCAAAILLRPFALNTLFLRAFVPIAVPIIGRLSIRRRPGVQATVGELQQSGRQSSVSVLRDQRGRFLICRDLLNEVWACLPFKYLVFDWNVSVYIRDHNLGTLELSGLSSSSACGISAISSARG
jgi:hypothetical protein